MALACMHPLPVCDRFRLQQFFRDTFTDNLPSATSASVDSENFCLPEGYILLPKGGKTRYIYDKRVTECDFQCRGYWFGLQSICTIKLLLNHVCYEILRNLRIRTKFKLPLKLGKIINLLLGIHERANSNRRTEKELIVCNEIVDFSKHIMIQKNPLYLTYLPYETRHFDAFRIAYYKCYIYIYAYYKCYICIHIYLIISFIS